MEKRSIYKDSSAEWISAGCRDEGSSSPGRAHSLIATPQHNEGSSANQCSGVSWLNTQQARAQQFPPQKAALPCLIPCVLTLHSAASPVPGPGQALQRQCGRKGAEFNGG